MNTVNVDYNTYIPNQPLFKSITIMILSKYPRVRSYIFLSMSAHGRFDSCLHICIYFFFDVGFSHFIGFGINCTRGILLCQRGFIFMGTFLKGKRQNVNVNLNKASRQNITSAPIWGWKWNFQPFDKIMTDKPSDRPTDHPTNR